MHCDITRSLQQARGFRGVACSELNSSALSRVMDSFDSSESDVG